MDLGTLVQWAVGALGALTLLLLNRVLKKLDALDERFTTVDGFIRTELRTLDVRVSVLENLIHKS